MIRQIVKYLLSPFRKSKFDKFLQSYKEELRNIGHVFGEDQTLRLLPWAINGFDSPSPNIVKWNVMRKWGGTGTWVETGTYLGETTYFLSSFSQHVESLEPADKLYLEAKQKFQEIANINIIHGTSESSLKDCLENLNSAQKLDLSFWLDGHYSAGVTYLGDSECPVLDELETIGVSTDFSKPLTILIDDVRGFSRTGELKDGYPSLTYLVEWADSMNLYWVIEHDIFIMTNRVLYPQNEAN